MEVTKTVKAKVVELTVGKRLALEVEYSNYQKAVLRAQGYDVVIACENLKHIRKRISGKLQWWAFRKLLDFVKYKAQWAGITYIEVEPANTSRTCPKCGHCDKNNRKGLAFKCTGCKYNANADLVGAVNVAMRPVAFPELYALGKGRHESALEVVAATPKAMILL